MIFGETPLDQAEGAVLAHSVRIGGKTLKKGRILDAADIAALAAAGLETVTAARLEAGDTAEDEAARRVAAALAPEPAAAGLTISAPFAGRVNLYAAQDGLFEVSEALVRDLNAIDESVTLATLEAPSWAGARRMLATVKIIPYAAPERAVAAAEAMASARADERPRLAPASRPTATLILTRTPGMSDKLLEKGAEAVRARLARLGVPLVEERTAPHRIAELATALGQAEGALVLVLAASATSDRRDVAPAAIEAAGGEIERLGMPVDPGNLLALGRIGEKAIVGLPGCARSPKLNGADWVLERLAAGRFPASAEIAAMGFGGLLKEIPSRPAPRNRPAKAEKPIAASASGAEKPRISGLLLAAGGSSRMGEGRHKLLETIADAPLIERSARALLAAGLDEALVVLGAERERMEAALGDLAITRVHNPLWREGMASSLRAGLRALSPQADAVLIALADMPLMDAGDIARLLAAFDSEEKREIVRPLGRDGRPGHPILFGRRFFESLAALEGDEGARRIVREHPEFIADIDIGGDAPLVDLDTPEAWDRFRKRKR